MPHLSVGVNIVENNKNYSICCELNKRTLFSHFKYPLKALDHLKRFDISLTIWFDSIDCWIPSVHRISVISFGICPIRCQPQLQRKRKEKVKNYWNRSYIQKDVPNETINLRRNYELERVSEYKNITTIHVLSFVRNSITHMENNKRIFDAIHAPSIPNVFSFLNNSRSHIPRLSHLMRNNEMKNRYRNNMRNEITMIFFNQSICFGVRCSLVRKEVPLLHGKLHCLRFE